MPRRKEARGGIRNGVLFFGARGAIETSAFICLRIRKIETLSAFLYGFLSLFPPKA